MAEIEITLPTVQYGNVKVRATPEELGLKSIADGYDLGVATAVYLNVFAQGFKKGASLDLDAPPAASQPTAEEQAQRHLDEGLGGVSEVDEYDSAAEAREATQARTAKAAPWDKPAVASQSKPWENGAKPPANRPVVDEGW